MLLQPLGLSPENVTGDLVVNVWNDLRKCDAVFLRSCDSASLGQSCQGLLGIIFPDQIPPSGHRKGYRRGILRGRLAG